ncbi:hypothetical protein [Nitrosopumilus ureiphilus]|uniref:Uncharacterized protein n=1 Tax=Nitrosopumilus ureiphilus TaxID=1470067 RepID=A0A7D5M3M9_9ARCH|nr:hypothetical protein [Nitrosopumilus ureiphilus]QLH06346.1 hypothetical protein C5F50_04090 [Nitrosopumilus ureiphilus]
MISSFKQVFQNKFYIFLASVIFTLFWIMFSVFGELLFFTPVFVFYLPSDAISVFILSNTISALMGIILSMNIYVLKNTTVKMNKSSFMGSSVGMMAGGCASCSSMGFVLLTSFGGAGVAASTFLSVYQIPLLVVSIGLLIWSYYSIHNKLTKSCVLNKTQ